MDPITLLGWVATGISLIGALYNARMNIAGQYLWLCSNALWIGYDVYFELWEQLPMFLAYTLITGYGVVHWKEHKKGGDKER